VLVILSLALVVLVVLSLAAPLLARAALGVRVVYAGPGLVCLVCALGRIFGLLAAHAALALPFGPPWAAMRLALDPLSVWFLRILGAADPYRLHGSADTALLAWRFRSDDTPGAG